MTIPPTMSVRDVLALKRAHKFSGLPVVDGRRVVGIVTNRDLRFETNLDQPVANIMTKGDQLVTVPEGTDLEDAKELMHRHRLERVLVVNDDDGAARPHHRQGHPEVDRAPARVQGRARPVARRRGGRGRGRQRRARRGAGRRGRRRASSSTPRTGIRRACSIASQWVKKRYPQVQVIGGNVATASGAQALVDHGADAVKVGIGPGSICTTRIVAGVGVPQISAIQFALEAWPTSRAFPQSPTAASAIRATSPRRSPPAHRRSCWAASSPAPRNRPARSSSTRGARTRAIAAWARSGAMQQGSSDRYFQDARSAKATRRSSCPEGIEGRVPYKGPLVNVDPSIDGRPARRDGLLRLRDDRRAAARAPSSSRSRRPGIRESHVHDVQIVKEAPNYRVE